MTARHFPPPWTSKVNAMITKELGAGMREVVIIATAGVLIGNRLVDSFTFCREWRDKCAPLPTTMDR